jgi:hypothetical protein
MMTRDGVMVPAETSVLCEGCGYTLDGLPSTGQCPECGLAIQQSLEGSGRQLPAWEDPALAAGPFWRFISTTASAVFRTRHFYQTLATRRYDRSAYRFAQLHWALSASLLAAALSIHAYWFQVYQLGPKIPGGPWVFGGVMAVLTYLMLWGTTRLAGRLTAWEAAYRGLRLPLPVVLRGLYYHAAHYLPVALLGFGTVVMYFVAIKLHWLRETTGVRYLLILCLEVVVGAGYLFKTYWTGMKSTMYANR